MHVSRFFINRNFGNLRSKNVQNLIGFNLTLNTIINFIIFFSFFKYFIHVEEQL